MVTETCIIISEYFGGLHGEEISKAHIDAIHCYWNESTCFPNHPHVPLVLCERFKGKIGEKLFCQLLALKTAGGYWIGTEFVQ